MGAESAEEKNLAGEAGNLGNAYRRSTSLPNLSWENIDNSLFSGYPIRNRLHVKRSRNMTVETVDGVDCSGWSHGDFSNNSIKNGLRYNDNFISRNSMFDSFE